MTTIQSITARADHVPSMNHVHVWQMPIIYDQAEQCAVEACQAVSVITHKRDIAGIEEHRFSAEQMSDDRIFAGGPNCPCLSCETDRARDRLPW